MLLKNLIFAQFSFIGSYNFCTFRPIQVLDALLNIVARWTINFLQIFLSDYSYSIQIYLFFLVAHFKQCTGLATPKKVFVSPLVIYLIINWVTSIYWIINWATSICWTINQVINCYKLNYKLSYEYILNYKLSYEYILNYKLSYKPSYILNYKLYIMIWIIKWIMRPLPATSTTSTVRPSHSSGTGVRLKVCAIKSHWDCNGSDTLPPPPPPPPHAAFFFFFFFF